MPADGTVVRNVNDGGFYRFAGGAPLFVRCDMGAGCTAPTMIDGQTMAKLGTYTPATPRMRQFPPDGVVVVNGDDNQHYRFAGGAPLPIAAPAGAKQIIDSRTLVQQGTATAALPHMRPNPADGTFLTAGGGVLARGGWRRRARSPTAACSATAPGAVPVDPATISGGGGGRLLAVPRDGTVLRGMPSNGLWEIIGGQRRQTFVNVAGVQVDDGAIGLIPVPPNPAPVVHHAAAEVRAGHLERLQGLPPLHAVHVAEGARRAGRVRDHRLLRRQEEGLPVQEGQAVPPEGQLAERLQPLVQEGQAQGAARPWWSASPARPVTASR